MIAFMERGVLYSGNRYEGKFKDDHGEGSGIFFYANGERHEGQFHNGKPVGKHKKYLNDGKIEEINHNIRIIFFL